MTGSRSPARPLVEAAVILWRIPTVAQRYAMAEQSPPYQAILAKGGVAGVAQASLIGDETEVLAQLRRLAEIGVSEFVASPFGDPETRTRTTALLSSLTR
jgi:alkanesulfonate monooxygenase SsuD/methylene tetrahydromethanopterin reductase-like flavin-dependent oxidoreductase (luciferase family)